MQFSFLKEQVQRTERCLTQQLQSITALLEERPALNSASGIAPATAISCAESQQVSCYREVFSSLNTNFSR